MRLEIPIGERLRPEKRFSGVDELREQIARDVADAKKVLGEGV